MIAQVRPGFWLTICKLNSACGKTSEEAREQSTIPSADSSKRIVAVAGMKKTQEGRLLMICSCMKSDTAFSIDHVHTHTSKACSWDGFQHELLQKAKIKTAFSAARDAWWERHVRKPQGTNRCVGVVVVVSRLPHLMVWTGKKCLISQLIDAALTSWWKHLTQMRQTTQRAATRAFSSWEWNTPISIHDTIKDKAKASLKPSLYQLFWFFVLFFFLTSGALL